MLGAADELAAKGIVVNAEVSRQMKHDDPGRCSGCATPGSSATPSSSTSARTARLSDETVDEFFGALSRRAAGCSC